IGMLFLRNDVEANILRLPGQLYEHKEGNIISNVYTFKLVNKTTRDIPGISFGLLSHNSTIVMGRAGALTVPAQELSERTLVIEIENADLEGDKTKLKSGVYSDGEVIETTSARFVAPRSYK